MSETANGKKKGRKATELERRRVNKFLDEYCKRVSGTEDEPGECEYIDDWTDEKIARLISPDISVSSVAGIRKAIFGNLHRPPKTREPDKELIAKVDRCAEQIGILGNALLALASAFNRFSVEANGDDRNVVSTAWEARLFADSMQPEAPTNGG